MGRQARKAPPLGIMLDTGAPEPLHRQIWRQLRQAILQRRLPPGTRLPSSRLLATELDCARGTILAALDQLVAEGYLVSRQGSGLSVATDLPDEMLAPPPAGAPQHPRRPAAPLLPQRTRTLLARDKIPDGNPAIAFPIGQPDRTAFPFPLWAKLLEQEWRRPAWPVAGAAYPFGHPGLRAAIAAYLGAARGFVCEPGAIVVTTGVRQSVALFAQVALEANDAAWIEEPGYPGMAAGLAAAQVRAVPVPVDAAGFSTTAAIAMAPHARLAVIAPSHHFPLGTVLILQRRLALLSWAERTQGWIVEDDFDGEYRYSGRPLAPLRALDRSGRVAYLGSFSKLLFPALRLSYLVLPAALVDATRRIIDEIFTPAPLLGQGALARFIADGHLAAHLRRTRILYAARQHHLIDASRRHLAGLLDIAPDPGGMHLVATSGAAGFDDRAATSDARRQGVQVSPLSACYAGLPTAQGLLLGYAGTPEPEIDPAVLRLRDALTRHPGPS